MKRSKITSRIVLVGGGHSHVQFLKNWRMRPQAGVEVVLISKNVLTPYSGMLPSRLAGWYDDADMHFNLAAIAAQSGVVFIQDEVVGVDLKKQMVELRERPSLYYDILSLDIGVTPSFPPGAEGHPHVLPVKPIASLLPRWEKLWIKEVSEGVRHWAVIGGGAAGFELAMIFAHTARARNRSLQISLIEGGSDILSGHSSSVRQAARELLRQAGVELLLDFQVGSVEARELAAADGRRLHFDQAILTTGGRAAEWLKASGLPVDEKGFVKVEPTLEVEGLKNVFATGDCAHFKKRELPKSGVYAVRQGPVLSENLRRACEGEVLQRYRPQRKTLSLLTSGERRAMMSYGPLHLEGAWLWKWKDRIDRRFMRRFSVETPGAMNGEHNTCGGCGGKMAAATVHEVIVGLGLPAQAEDVGWVGETAATIDGFRTFTSDLYFFGEVAVWHALNDIFASGGKVTGVNVYVGLPESSGAIRANRLHVVMSGILKVLKEIEAPLLNAHSAEAFEPTLVISALGSAQHKRRKGGMKPGDVLIMTKSIGTGALLQAEMAGGLSAETRARLHAALLIHHAKLAGVLGGYSVSACTDISGFGLLGHLSEMVIASRVAVELYPEEVPVLEGFREWNERGFKSFLSGENAKSFASYVDGACDPWKWEALWDPQTNGPLLLAVPIKRAEALLKHLEALGFRDAAVIGRVADEIGARPEIRLKTRAASSSV